MIKDEGKWVRSSNCLHWSTGQVLSIPIPVLTRPDQYSLDQYLPVLTRPDLLLDRLTIPSSNHFIPPVPSPIQQPATSRSLAFPFLMRASNEWEQSARRPIRMYVGNERRRPFSFSHWERVRTSGKEASKKARKVGQRKIDWPNFEKGKP